MFLQNDIDKKLNLMAMKKIIQLTLISVFVFSACDLNQTDIETEINLTEKTARLLEAEN
jgi:hypothetical protein